MDFDTELVKAMEMLKGRLEILKESGLTYIGKAEAVGSVVSNNDDVQMEVLRKAVADCRACQLCENRKNIVFGQGSIKASVVFVGEAPGAEEDEQGEPFVGRSGKLLTKMIEAMGIAREQVYICNVVKCRPPENRNPTDLEIASCSPFLTKQLAIIRPKIIVGLGRFACSTLLQTKTPMAEIRGQWHQYEGIKFMPTFHPAYLLRNPSAKKLVWQDLQEVLRHL